MLAVVSQYLVVHAIKPKGTTTVSALFLMKYSSESIALLSFETIHCLFIAVVGNRHESCLRNWKLTEER